MFPRRRSACACILIPVIAAVNSAAYCAPPKRTLRRASMRFAGCAGYMREAECDCGRAGLVMHFVPNKHGRVVHRVHTLDEP